MNRTRFFTTLICALLLATVTSFAHEAKHKIKLKIDGMEEALKLDLDDMEVGETQQLFTESGKEVVVTRQEEGYKLEVDGKEILIASPGGHGKMDGKKMVFISEDGETTHLGGDGAHTWVSADGEGEKIHKIVIGGEGEGEGHHKIRVEKIGDGEDHEGHAFAFVTGDEAHHEGHHEGHHNFVVKTEDAAERLSGSGLLDELDDETREKILDFLKEGDHEIVRVKKIVIGDEDEDE
jgi:hypothetical protein